MVLGLRRGGARGLDTSQDAKRPGSRAGLFTRDVFEAFSNNQLHTAKVWTSLVPLASISLEVGQVPVSGSGP